MRTAWIRQPPHPRSLPISRLGKSGDFNATQGLPRGLLLLDLFERFFLPAVGAFLRFAPRFLFESTLTALEIRHFDLLRFHIPIVGIVHGLLEANPLARFHSRDSLTVYTEPWSRSSPMNECMGRRSLGNGLQNRLWVIALQRNIDPVIFRWQSR